MIIIEDGDKVYPRYLGALPEIKRPNEAGKLQELLWAPNLIRDLIRDSIADYDRQIPPLHELLEIVYRNFGKRYKQIRAQVSVDDLWGSVHEYIVNRLRNQLSLSTKNAHPRMVPSNGFILTPQAHTGHIY